MIGLDRNVLALGTTLVQSEPLDLLQAGAPCTFTSGFIVAVDGPPGCGKTTALTQLVRTYDGQTCAVSLDPCSTNKDVVAQVHLAVVGTHITSRTRRTEMQADLRAELASTRRLLVIDEAQNSSVSALQMIRHLHMDPTATFDLVLCGSGLDKKLSSEAMLANRVGQWARFQPIDNANIPATLSALHPLFARTDDDALMRADAQICHGVLREWVKVLGFLQRMASKSEPVTDRHLEQALTMVAGQKVKLAR